MMMMRVRKEILIAVSISDMSDMMMRERRRERIALKQGDKRKE